ncbi:glycosyltransferase family 39 protein [Runella slithyformis]|uniref:Glycosyl transferase family 39 n=1 Tax=Runella slithyformis (strain ATCC 29530 / DSM 19594 / LMG 11500 / NCIMB 11436 / LSU 4) TaxID=761193 RepID=A0A7U3ZG70_RUNSL|nr:glycosyltransferase family 39 protein [Runella slithyformis]AEI46636.1 glycosyl transferase family 39 [Runella slithyformis DSM 19594]
MEKLNRSIIGVTMILALAFCLRVYHSGTYGIYLDEKYTMIISQGIVMEGANQKEVFFTPGKTVFTPAEFWKKKNLSDFIEANIRGDIGNSPVYYGVLWVWMKIFGLSDFSARFPSVLFSTLIVLLLYVFVKRHFKSESLALISAFLAAIEPFFVAYSHMARNYSMSFFLTLLATHLFLLIVQKQRESKPTWKLLIAYGFTLTVSVLSHYLTVTVFMCHGLYVLLYVRPLVVWRTYLITAVAGLAMVSLWFIYGGGKYTFQTLAYQAQLYKSVSLTNPLNNEFGEVLPATLVNVANKSLPVWADLFIISNGLGQLSTLGIRNLAIAFFFGIIAVGIFHRFRRKEKIPPAVLIVYPLLFLAGLPLFTVPNLQLVVAAALPSFVYILAFGIRHYTTKKQQPLMVFLFILTLFPTLFLILMAFKNGHTYGITQRYSGFSFPYAVILIAFMVKELSEIPMIFRSVLAMTILLQFFFITRLLNAIYLDKAPKYTYFYIPRGPNPHYAAAQQIKKLYQPGDTVVYPSRRLYFRDDIEKTYWPYSIQDAQLTNLYLPKDAGYVQRMDTTEVDKIKLVKAGSRQEIVLFDLKGKTHRY